jgi:hypothetical protein
MEKTTYKELMVWQRAIEFVPKVQELVKHFPHYDRYGLSDQIRRAGVNGQHLTTTSQNRFLRLLSHRGGKIFLMAHKY